MPQQYSNRRPHREGRTAESGPAGLGEGQRRSGGGDAHGPSPYHRRSKEALSALNLGGTTKRHTLSSQSQGTGALIFPPPHEKSERRSNHNGKNDPPDPVRLYGTAGPRERSAFSGDPLIELKSSEVNSADFKVFSCGKNA